jgi:15-cis-phytoene synthase
VRENAEIAALLRAGDKNRYLASLFAPDDLRRHLQALYAFNTELVRIRSLVSEPAIGEIRLQWWIDALPAIHAGEPPAHPVAVALAGAVRHGNLPLAALLNLAEARRFDLYDDPMPTLADLEGYLGETAAASIQLGAMILVGDRAQKSAEAAGLAGVSMGIAGILRTLSLHRARGQCYVPREMLEKHNASVGDLLSGRAHAGVGAAIAELIAHGRKRLAEARALMSTIAGDVFPAFLRASLAEPYFDRLESAGHAILTQDIEVSQLRRQYTLWRSARRHRF